MFFQNQDPGEQTRYVKLLQLFGSLSGLYSKGDIPYLYYRIAEKVFCRTLNAVDHSRSDISIDVSKNGYGIGLKTFIAKKTIFEKISEFNRDSSILHTLLESPQDLANKAADLYNKRIMFARNSIDAADTIFHCVRRRRGEFILCEYPMSLIDQNRIRIGDVKRDKRTNLITSLPFSADGINYRFNVSKSTLYRDFSAVQNPYVIPIDIIEDPFSLLERLLVEEGRIPAVPIEEAEELAEIGQPEPEYEYVILPLYSEKGGINVPEKSGLNHWNAEGRGRHPDEAYIPIPSWIHKKFPGFFLPRHVQFNLKLPNGNILLSKVCSSNDKSIMSNPNKDLGNWLLRKVLNIPVGVLATYEMLEEVGIDSVEVRKLGEFDYEINFKALGTYAAFQEEYNQG